MFQSLMASSMTSPGHNVGQIMKLMYIRQYLSRAQNGDNFENFEILNTASIWPQIWKNCPKLCQRKVISIMMMSSMKSQGGLKVGPQILKLT